MTWELVELTYTTNNGEQTHRHWVGSQSNDTISLEVLAGDQQQSTPSEYKEDTENYTEVFVRAIHKASGAFLWLDQHSEGIQVSVNELSNILASLADYEDEPKHAYQVL